MDDVVKRLAKELADAIAAAVARDPHVESCRERARAAGYEVQVSLEAVVGFSNRVEPGTKPPARRSRRRRPLEINDADRRFLRSLRIAPDETVEVEKKDQE